MIDATRARKESLADSCSFSRVDWLIEGVLCSLRCFIDAQGLFARELSLQKWQANLGGITEIGESE